MLWKTCEALSWHSTVPDGDVTGVCSRWGEQLVQLLPSVWGLVQLKGIMSQVVVTSRHHTSNYASAGTDDYCWWRFIKVTQTLYETFCSRLLLLYIITIRITGTFQFVVHGLIPQGGTNPPTPEFDALQAGIYTKHFVGDLPSCLWSSTGRCLPGERPPDEMGCRQKCVAAVFLPPGQADAGGPPRRPGPKTCTHRHYHRVKQPTPACWWTCVYLLVVLVASGLLLGDALLDGRQGVRREALKALWSHWKHTASHLLILILLLTGPVYQLQTHTHTRDTNWESASQWTVAQSVPFSSG